MWELKLDHVILKCYQTVEYRCNVLDIEITTGMPNQGSPIILFDFDNPSTKIGDTLGICKLCD